MLFRSCGPWCACTGYAIKRRMLREHRVLMRCMYALIVEHGLDAELDALWESNGDPRPGRGFGLDYDSELDELSDAEDLEQQLRAELADRSALVQAVQGALECRSPLVRGGGAGEEARPRKKSDGRGGDPNAVLHATTG